MTLPESGWKGHGRPGYQCEAQQWLDAARQYRCSIYTKTDIVSTARHRGDYIAPDASPLAACHVAMWLETIAIPGRRL